MQPLDGGLGTPLGDSHHKWVPVVLVACQIAPSSGTTMLLLQAAKHQLMEAWNTFAHSAGAAGSQRWWQLVMVHGHRHWYQDDRYHFRAKQQ